MAGEGNVAGHERRAPKQQGCPAGWLWWGMESRSLGEMTTVHSTSWEKPRASNGSLAYAWRSWHHLGGGQVGNCLERAGLTH